ncbi:DinB family protein [Pseudofrankia sp. BMG5.37]|uniref:DinB family protein n=1 Tax=Pseudofrankia sp. BMG5.37 TaxID=3050035 RepID=UPI002894310B|nr:DinB family protein [Pseudofrankia sp. BMG5.37]MDT3443012.1 DinB family protein [Pseudofrankia sp. BMG5.37]
MTDQTWNSLLRDQLAWHWTHQLCDRLDGLTDDEYFWEPVPGCWNVRPRGTGTAPVAAGAGAMTIDFAAPPPEPPPFATIAWRLGHVIVGVLAMRNAAHFGRAPTDYRSFEYAATATGALAQLDAEYATWLAGVESLGDTGLARPCGAAEGPYAEFPLAALVLHINRELIHHLAEVCLLRDLCLHTHQHTQHTTRQQTHQRIRREAS